MDNTDYMSEQEILKELIEDKRKREGREKLIVGIVAVVGLFLICGIVFIIVNLIPAIKTYNEMMIELDGVKDEAMEILRSITVEDIEGIKKAISHVASFSPEDIDSLKKTLEQISAILSIFVGA